MVARVKETLGITKSRVQEIYNFQLDPVFTEDKLIDRKDWFKQNNVEIDDIKERPNKIWEKCEKEPEFNSKCDSGINFIVIFLLLTQSKWFQWVFHAWAKSGWIERYYLDSRQSKHFIQTKFL